MSDLSDNLDPGDIFSIIQMLRDADDSLTLESPIIRDIIQFTQSNPTRSTAIIAEMIDLDDQIAEL